MLLKTRASILKQYEADCYSTCLYLLQCEQKACEAALNALLQLIGCDAFFAADPQGQRLLLLHVSMKSALSVLIGKEGTADEDYTKPRCSS
ncbi:hypothetical protein [Paenibacillus thalictri]|uniref:Uncharacterized protein n=1 Tax=Paenibacillus thalictri TaxID=2527873 RepID=A0A4Q9DI55_9BACL|nr:hypothetical protein [Paenibacillus thalictri]TBL70883.1 hypothetical protein EYB31_32085 [Paenibacillus thalictri]